MAQPPAPPVRLRLVFDNQRLLRRSQRESGLRRCWLLLAPDLSTVADLAAHVAARFRLRRSCPRGVILSMDGFVLPPFESTCIFRDNDIIRVIQKASNQIALNNDVHCIQDPEVVEKRPLPTNDEILAIEYQNDNNRLQQDVQCNHQNEDNATGCCNIQSDHATLKRKCQDGDRRIPETSKKKKLKVTNPGKHIGSSNEDITHQGQEQGDSRKLKSPSIDIDAKKTVISAEPTVALEEEQKTERNQTELDCKTKVADCNAQSDTKKVQTRSSRRKKLKRELRRKAKEQLAENVLCQESPTTSDCPSPSNRDALPCPSSNQRGNQNDSHILEADEEESDASDDIVPVVVRPGHIRFEPAGGEPTKSPVNEIQNTFQWSGTMSKKKGQKWGMNSSDKKSASISDHDKITGSNIEINRHVVDSKATENGFLGTSNQVICESSHNGSASEKTVVEERKSSGEPFDFESLYPLTRLPKEGDLIVYRLLELSSSWCPEVSSHRVGKVLIYDPISLRIILLPVPEYPIITEEKNDEDESDMMVDMSPYKDDGTLEIEYSSLLDVRLLKGTESIPPAVSTPRTETGKKGGSLVKMAVTVDKNKGTIPSHTTALVPNNTKEPEATPVPNKTKEPEATPGKTQNKVWEESGEASNDKPEVQENGWGTWKPNASTSAWSYRALRSSALGPTVALLRGSNSSKRGKPSNRKYGK